jgi:hypothetical protein
VIYLFITCFRSISNKVFPDFAFLHRTPPPSLPQPPTEMINEPLLNIPKVFHSLWFFIFKFSCTKNFPFPKSDINFHYSPMEVLVAALPGPRFCSCERQDSFSISQHDLCFSFRKLKTSSSDEFWKFYCSFDFDVTFSIQGWWSDGVESGRKKMKNLGHLVRCYSWRILFGGVDKRCHDGFLRAT